MKFGNKNKFAIEIFPSSEPVIGYIQIWFNNLSIGNQKKSGEFIHAVFDYKKFIKIYKTLFEDRFKNMVTGEIIEYILAENLIWSNKKEDLCESERRQIYVRFFGDQFDGLCSFFSLYRDGIITVIVWNFKNVKNEFQTFEIEENEYLKVFNEYINWFNKNLSKYYPDYSCQ